MINAASYYKADDLMINALYDEGCSICGNPQPKKTSDYPNDSFTPTESKKNKNIKTGLKIGGIAIGGTMLWKLAKKIFTKKP